MGHLLQDLPCYSPKHLAWGMLPPTRTKFRYALLLQPREVLRAEQVEVVTCHDEARAQSCIPLHEEEKDGNEP